MPHTHHLPDEQVHFTWDTGNEPVLMIDSIRRCAGCHTGDDRPHRDELHAGREDAYVLCSLAVDLKISEIVDAGQYIVSAVLPEALFSGW